MITSAGIHGPLGQSNIELAKTKGLQVVLAEAFAPGTTDFSALLTKVRAANPDALFVGTLAFEEGVAITRQLKASNVNPRMVGFTPTMAPPTFYEVLGRDAEFAYVGPPFGWPNSSTFGPAA